MIVKVIDSSSLIKYVAREEDWEEVEEHIREGCVTVDLAVKETANALVKKMLKNEVDPETAKEILDHIPRIVKVKPQQEHLSKALEIAAKHGLPIYDTIFIALSGSMDASLLTSDERQAEISRECGVKAILL